MVSTNIAGKDNRAGSGVNLRSFYKRYTCHMGLVGGVDRRGLWFYSMQNVSKVKVQGIAIPP